MKKLVAAAAMAACAFTSTAAHAQREPSLYLRCDGEPNNMTGGEQFARFLGAITLLGLFAPSPETPTPSARWFGQRGVDACTQLIDGEDGEGNPVRRIPLILARALHRIEAEDYAGALTDVEIARAEAEAAELAGNPYFDRSMGLSFNNIAAAAHLRMGNPELARDTSLANIADMQYSFVPSLFSDTYSRFVRDLSPEADIKLSSEAAIMPVFMVGYAAALDEVGRFGDSAAANEALITTLEGIATENTGSLPYARAAVAHGLADNWSEARDRAQFARRNMSERTNRGQPEDNQAAVVELLDFFSIVEMEEEGDLEMARRMFAARSQWTAPSFGAVLAMTDRLREGAAPEELFGSLALSGNEMWQRRYDDLMAIELQNDTDNDSLFNLIVNYAQVDEFEDRASHTWRLERSRLMADEADEDGQWAISAQGSPYSSIDSIMLHAALQAQERGYQGFTMLLGQPRPAYGGAITTGWARFVNPGDPHTDDLLFIPADEVIVELRELIPTRDEVRERRRERRRNR
ncbi:hypothetical protein [Aurantiacibacter sp. D1-12]|uniref:hypothetical protein n=1 Tax=Aurantiacibacter sp. D1-12 TaxID=2993658 RepID=UPI00237C74E3|nr:hypothetical protein [Aurantiacibacter sp. D1-12]MDE1468477.1 hypothetical protein [Aurantiacibacter sp. D1-12]